MTRQPDIMLDGLTGLAYIGDALVPLDMLRLMIGKNVVLHTDGDSAAGMIVDVVYADEDYVIMLDWGWGIPMRSLTDVEVTT
jgi:hypothetical protein